MGMTPSSDSMTSLAGGASAPPVASGERRILAVALPELLEELVLERPFRVTEARAPRGEPRIPRAIILSELQSTMIDPDTRLDAVNAAAREAGVNTRQTIAQATARVRHLAVHALPPARVTQALQRVAEAALGFGSPVSFRAPDTVWVDISGSRQLFGGERELALGLAAVVRALGHSVRIAGAPGPWLARAFARHADFDGTGVFLVDAARARQASAFLPIGALPISSESVAWFARLGLLCLDDLRKLPSAALAVRLAEMRLAEMRREEPLLEEQLGFERTLDLIVGRDESVLDAYLPEELPFEEQSWDFPLESVEPLLFVLKGMTARLGARLEGRGQAAQELQLTIRYDKSIATLVSREEALSPDRSPPEALELPFRLASPLTHAEDLERIVRSRLLHLRGDETLFAPTSGVRLQVTALTEARQFQLSLGQQGLNGAGLGSTLSTDPRTLAVLTAELRADLGDAAVGLLEAHDSHVLEKSSRFVPIHQLAGERRAPGLASTSPIDRHPTRLLSPIEFRAPLREKEIVVLERRAFVIEAIVFEERLEAVEWWGSAPVSRDYFRLWLTSTPIGPARVAKPLAAPTLIASRPRSEGLEVLVYLNRDDGKKYVQGLYD
jgi:protein ImuB